MPVESSTFIALTGLAAASGIAALVYVLSKRGSQNESSAQFVQGAKGRAALDQGEISEEQAQLNASVAELSTELDQLYQLVEKLESKASSQGAPPESAPFLPGDDLVLVDLEGIDSIASEVVRSNEERRAELERTLATQGEHSDWVQESRELVSAIEHLAETPEPDRLFIAEAPEPDFAAPVELVEAVEHIEPVEAVEIAEPVESPEAAEPEELAEPEAAAEFTEAADSLEALKELESPEPPLPASPDDLKEIRGIGKVIEGVLNENGIETFDQLAGLSVDAIEELSLELKRFSKRLVRDRWIEQAQELVAERAD